MRKISYKFLLVVGFFLALGNFSTTHAVDKKDDKVKRPKNTGVLSVKTTPQAMPIFVDGVQVGMSGVSAPAEYFLAPGMHKVEVMGTNGQSYVKDVEIRKNASSCICLKMIENSIGRACPYNISIDGPDKVTEGDLVTFATFNAVSNSPNPINYVWTITPSNARVTSGLGTSSITIDTTGLAGQTVSAEVDVNDGFNDATCRQRITTSTVVAPIPPKPVVPLKFDEFDSVTFDDDKARLDNFVIDLQNNPDSQAYIIMYQGTDRVSVKQRNVELLSKRTLDYLVKVRGVDPKRIWIVKGGTRPRTQYQLWRVPPGAPTPVPE
jgi:PEGA domain